MAEAPAPDLRGMLRRLHLTGMADNFADLALKAAAAHLTYEAYLTEVVECECVLRAQRRIARLLRQSGLPAEKTFETLQLDRFPLVAQQQVEHLRRGTFIGDAFNLVVVGKPGVGKSHLLAALGRELILHGIAVWWTSAASLVQRLLAAKRDLRLPQELKRLDRYGCECPECETRYLGEQRCQDCNRFCRVVGLGGACTDCEQPILLSDLLDLEV